MGTLDIRELRRPFGSQEKSVATRAEIARAVAVLAAAYPRQPLTDETVRLYTLALADVPVPELVEAVEGVIKTSRMFPSVGEIRRRVAQNRLRPLSAEDALAMVSHAITEGDFIVADGLTLKVARAVGVDAQASAENGAGVWRGQFLKVYAAMLEDRLISAAAGDFGAGT